MFQAIVNWFKSLFGIASNSAPVLPFPVLVPVPTPGEEDGQIYGPDLSHYEPGANWSVVATDNAFGITKATEGTSYVDDLFKSYWPAMGDALQVRGAYHFFHPSQDAIAQAEHFLSTVGPLKSYDFLVLDWEVTDGLSPAAQQAGARQFLEHVRQKTGKLPWLYSSRSFFTENIQLAEFAQYTIWMAELGSKLSPVAPFREVALWQYTFTGKYKGVPNPCDGNVFNGSIDQMKALIIKP